MITTQKNEELACLFHCPRGAAKRKFKPFVSYFLLNSEMPAAPTVEIITYNNTQMRFSVQFQAARLGLKLHVVAQDFHPWSWVAKITEPKKLLESKFSPDQFVMLIDCSDTIFTRPPHIDEIKSALSHYGSAEVLFCPTPANWPPDAECRDFERRQSNSAKPHLSAGAYVGSVKAILEGMEWIEERRAKGHFLRGGRFDDQLAWRKAHLAFHPKFAIDTKGLLFNRFDHPFLRSVSKEEMIWQPTHRIQNLT